MRSPRRSSLLLVGALLAHCVSSTCWAQGCESEWLPGLPSQAIYGSIETLLPFDPDGAGPLGSWLVAGGLGLAPIGMPTNGLLAFDGTRWRGLPGSSTPGVYVKALTVFNNQLIAAGRFSSIGGVTANNIARWDGTTWLPLAQGVADSNGLPLVNALEVYNGSLYVGGDFETVGPGLSSPCLARWDGTAWSSVVSSISPSSPIVRALRTFRNSLYVGGDFTSINGVSATNLAAWNGSTWSTAGQPNGSVRDIERYTGLALTQDRLFVGGSFSTIGSQTIDRVAAWNPTAGTWAATGTLPTGPVNDLFVRTTATSYQLAGIFGSRAATLSTGTWTTLGDSGGGSCRRIGFFNGQYVVGRQSNSNDELGSCVQTWNSSFWGGLGVGAPGTMVRLMEMDDGATVGAWLSRQDGFGESNNYISMRASGSDLWTVLGGKVQQLSVPVSQSVVNALAKMPNSDIVAGGYFTGIGSVASPWLARWNGSAWSTLGTSFNFTVNALQVMPNGDLVAGGGFSSNTGGPGMQGLARWNGSTWSSIGGGLTNDGYVTSLALASNGDLIVGGSFTSIGSPAVAALNIARWNGSSWSPMNFTIDVPGSSDYVWRLATFPDGRVAACYHNTPASPPYGASIHVWNGTGWSQIVGVTGSLPPMFYDIATLPDGSLVTAGYFNTIQGVTASSIARWDGSWHRMGEIGVNMDGVAPTTFPTIAVNGLFTTQTGQLLVGGDFSHADALVSGYFATWGVPEGCSACDSIDFNNDGSLFDPDDVDAFFSVFSEGPCIPATATCNDLDFNNDGSVFDPCDLDAFLLAFSEGPCTLCGQ